MSDNINDKEKEVTPTKVAAVAGQDNLDEEEQGAAASATAAAIKDSSGKKEGTTKDEEAEDVLFGSDGKVVGHTDDDEEVVIVLQDHDRLEEESSQKQHNPLRRICCYVFAFVFLAVILNVYLYDGDDTPIPPPLSVDLSAISTSTIQETYNTCDELKVDLIQATRYLANTVISRNARYHDFSREFVGGFFKNRGHHDSVALMGSSAAPAGITEDSFGTNNQVNGVDEADIVKSDGKYVYAAYGQEIVKLNATAVTVESRTTISSPPNNGSEMDCFKETRIVAMLLIDHRLVVVTSNGYCSLRYSWDTSIIQGDRRTQVLTYDTTDMSLVYSKYLRGNYISARSIDGNVHVITNSNINSYHLFTKHLEVNGNPRSEGRYRRQAQEEAVSHTNNFVEQLVEELDCTATQKVTVFQNSDSSKVDLSDFGTILESLATVYSFDVVDPDTTFSSTSMILPTSAYGLEIFSSGTQLVLATHGWFVDESGQQAREETYLIAYHLNGPRATPTSFGVVPGYVLNQFSIDHTETDGVEYLRVATTIGERWMSFGFGGRFGWSRSQDNTTSLVTILQIPTVQDDDDDDGNKNVTTNSRNNSTVAKQQQVQEMAVVGELTGLGHPGERIYSVRFQGNHGFVVTFRQTDPFYTLDLSDPFNPKEAGELKIPGFSNYLHPIGDDLILGVGQDADESGRIQGLQVSLFDVSIFDDPKRIHNYIETVGDHSSSDAQYDHKAFRYLNDSKLLILPVTVRVYDWDEDSNGNDNFDGFRIYSIDKDDGIEPYFDIEHGPDRFDEGCWSLWGLQPRSLVFGGDIMTLKSHSIMSHDLTTKVADAQPINLDEGLEGDDCHNNYYYFIWW